MKKPLLICLFLSWAVISEAQQSPPPNIKLPTVIPASPEATDIAKYLNYPVDYSNGLTNIDIPLFEIKDGDITIPISISYHASGFKVYEAYGWLGSGWTLNAEPIVSRSIQGLPDENSYLLDGAHSPQTRNHATYRKDLAEGAYDEQPDEFYYKLINESGKFFIKKEFGLATEIITIPYRPEKIAHTNNLSQFTITDTKGLSYEFGGIGSSLTEHTYSSKTTAWKCSAITSLLTGRSVSFSYHTRENRPLPILQDDRITVLSSMGMTLGPLELESNPLQSGGPPPEFQLPMPVVITQKYNNLTYHKVAYDPFGPPQLVQLPIQSSGFSGGEISTFNLNIHEINFSEGKLVFEKANSMLQAIKLYDKSNDLIKSYFFFHSHQSGSARIRLDSVVVKDASLVSGERYQFLYNGHQPQVSGRSVDLWGFFNNSFNDNQSLLPQLSISALSESYGNLNFNIGGGDRESDEQAMQVGILKSIIYPTGGKTDFEYEAHRYKDSQNNIKLAGGLRIRTITNTDEKGQPIIRNIKYGKNEDGTGFLYNPITNDDFFFESQDIYIRPNIIGLTHLPGDIYAWYPSSSIFYVRRQTYSSNPLINLFYDSGSSVKYDEVSEYTSKDNTWNTTTIGKKVYKYNVFSLPSSGKYLGKSIIIDYKTDWYGGEETFEGQYKQTGTSFIPVARKFNEYSTTHLPNKSFVVAKTYKNNNVISDGGSQWLPYENITYVPYTIQSGYKNLTKVIDTIEFEPIVVAKEQSFTYDSFLNLEEENTISSNGLATKIIYTHPYDEGMSFHTGVNNISPVITKKTYVNNVLIDHIRNEYYFNSGSGSTISPFQRSLYYALGNNPLEKRISYNNYDNKGNILSVSKEKGAETSYIWSYDNQYPVAEISNASYSQIKDVLGESSITSFANTRPNKSAIDNFIAPLKTALPNAHIRSFEYQPLVGMKSQTDPRGVTTYYEYDSFNRLVNIRDQHHSIVKNFAYNYQKPYSGIYFSNQNRTQNFTRNNCPNGGGGTVSYSVPAGRYKSIISVAEANRMADAEILAEGQNYANTYGSCPVENVDISLTVTNQSSTSFSPFIRIDNNQLGTNIVNPNSSINYSVNRPPNSNSQIVAYFNFGGVPTSVVLSGAFGSSNGVWNGSVVSFDNIDLSVSQNITLTLN